MKNSSQRNQVCTSCSKINENSSIYFETFQSFPITFLLKKKRKLKLKYKIKSFFKIKFTFYLVGCYHRFH